MKVNTIRKGLRRHCRWAVGAALLALSGCSMMMPAEISAMEARTTALAQQLAREQPGAAGDYQVGSRRMHYVATGIGTDKPLVIFIHGSPGGWEGWVDYLLDRELAAKAQLISFDRPGFGGSGRGEVERSLPQQARDAAPLLDRANPGQRVVLVGHSFGGPLAARMAMDYGSKVTDIIILAGSIDPALEETAWYQYPADWPVIAWMLPDELVVTNREIRALKGELTDMLPLWPRITQRVTVIQGGKDNLVPSANADFAQRMLTGAESVQMTRLPETNHFIPWTRMELVKSAILRHLQ